VTGDIEFPASQTLVATNPDKQPTAEDAMRATSAGRIRDSSKIARPGPDQALPIHELPDLDALSAALAVRSPKPRHHSGNYWPLVSLKTKYADWSLSSASRNWVTVAGGRGQYRCDSPCNPGRGRTAP
jgi:hypothetical protein